ncbi:MAG: tetratricopeptide repeat protein [Candidatus Korobacteraceae bacterium]
MFTNVNNNSFRALALAVLLAIAGPAFLSAQETSAKDEIRAGLLAYQFSNYQSAAEHFQAALTLDPASIEARLGLATSYAQQYIPGDQSEANAELATQAISEFKTVLQDDPTDQQRYQSTVSVASLSFNLKRWDDAGEYYMKAIELNPDDAHNYDQMGVIDWTLAYPPRVKMRTEMHLSDSEMISDPAACASLRAQNGHYVEDGIQSLEKALQLQPDDDDAMAYMNLLYRERAEYECDQPDARKADLKTADEWVDKAMAAKKAKAEKTTTDTPH